MPDETNTVVPPTNAPTPTLPTVAVPDASASVDGATNAGAIDAGAPASDVVVTPDAPVAKEEPKVADPEIPAEVARKIGGAHNVLVALSSDPSVDEMAAAIGLSLYLDKLGKRATAIYSGQTPNALQFLKPEETFENSVDTLQDFVIALNKEKADHLRYKLDGDYVKIYITPYKSRIAEEDLEFSYGDYNVDLVLALDVANGVDLDSALREHGRIMHDAVIINITTGNPGKLGEIEWSDKSASSVSEMIARLLYNTNSKVKIEKEEATAFLTGIVAATNRFSNAGTTPETMQLASRLMESGANQQLVSKNITPDVENEMTSMMSMGEETNNDGGDPTLLDIQHGNEEGVDENKVVDETVTEKDSSLLDDLKAAEASLAAAGAEVAPEAANEPLKIDGEVEAGALPEVADAVKQEADNDANIMSAGIVDNETKAEPSGDLAAEASAPEAPAEGGLLSDNAGGESATDDGFSSNNAEKVIQPPAEMSDPNFMNDTGKYGQMMEDALASVNNPMGGAPGMPTVTPDAAPMVGVAPTENPAAAAAPSVAANPEINGVPEINYMPMPGEEVLPPPPTPPIADAASVPVAAGPAPAADPGAFKIPGM